MFGINIRGQSLRIFQGCRDAKLMLNLGMTFKAAGVLRRAFVQILNPSLYLTALRRPSFGLRLVLLINDNLAGLLITYIYGYLFSVWQTICSFPPRSAFCIHILIRI